VDRFWSKVKAGSADDCWLWQGSTSGSKNHQYGQFTLSGGLTQRLLGAHVFAYELAHGWLSADGQKVCHRCDNPPCCNPGHLFLGDHTANMRDAASKGRLSVPRPGAQSLTAEQVHEVRELVWSGALQKDVAERYGVSLTLITLLMKGNRRQYDAPLQPRLVRRAS
jgi:hypothetical protein